MPPALSDYDSSSGSEADCVVVSLKPRGSQFLRNRLCESVPSTHRHRYLQVLRDRHSKRAPATNTVSRKRKRTYLLSGLDMSNIIMIPSEELVHSTAEDSPPVSSMPPPSSYMTRGSTSGNRSPDLAYDQKYHPIDEFLRPSQAAKRRAEHGLDDEESEEADHGECYDSESDSDIDIDNDIDSNINDQPQTKKRKRRNKPTARQGIRRSARQVNRDVLYNANVHPQDEQLRQINTDSSIEEINDEEATSAPGVEEREIVSSNDDASNLSASSSPRSTPLSMISIDNMGYRTVLPDSSFSGRHIRPRLEPTPFVIYEEPLHIQLAKEAAAEDPVEFEDDDKENPVEEAASTGETSDNITVRPISAVTAIGTTDGELGYTYDLQMEYHHPSSMFDGANENVGVTHHQSPRPTMPIEAHDPSRGSVTES
ncbi:hypothetical protein N0V90_003523 [Kalmusia sp. IMI 367209]|nr:hypothetical protein N0V90_003523 [Kalmusia sp. IMI 367209]